MILGGRIDKNKLSRVFCVKGLPYLELMNYKSIFQALGRNIRTNMTFDEIVDIQKNYRSALGKVERLHFQKGNGQMIDGIWYYVMDDAELLE